MLKNHLRKVFFLAFLLVNLVVVAKANVTVIRPSEKQEVSATTTQLEGVNIQPTLEILQTTYRVNREVEVLEILKNPANPTLIFFGGQDERKSVYRTNCVLDGRVPEGWNILCCALYEPDTTSTQEWKRAMRSLVEFVLVRIRDGVIDMTQLYIDGYSYGGSGAFWLAESLLQSGITAKALTWIDAAVSQVKQSDLQNLLSCGVSVNVFAASAETSENDISARGRNIVYELNGESGFHGEIISHGHGNGIVAYVYDTYHLHAN